MQTISIVNHTHKQMKQLQLFQTQH